MYLVCLNMNTSVNLSKCVYVTITITITYNTPPPLLYASTPALSHTYMHTSSPGLALGWGTWLTKGNDAISLTML